MWCQLVQAGVKRLFGVTESNPSRVVAPITPMFPDGPIHTTARRRLPYGVCWSCEGTGTDLNTNGTCRKCRGTGKFDAERYRATHKWQRRRETPIAA